MVHQVSPVTIDLEGKPVAKVDRYQGGDTTYQTVVSWTVSPGKRGWLQEVSMITDKFDKTQFRLKIAEETLFEDKQIQSSLTLPFPWNELDEGSVVLLECRSTDGTAIIVDGSITGREA
jgi:hypothetical protein